MREIDFHHSEIGQAFEAWLTIFNDIVELTAAVAPSFTVVVESVDRADWRRLNEVLGFTAGPTYDAAKRHLASGNETLHVLFLLAAWGAFESFIESVPAAMIRIDPGLISAQVFDKARSRAEREGLTGIAQSERVVEIAVVSQKTPLTPDGGGKYENQLALVGLDGPVPHDLALALMEAQQVRNVWAHNGGRADKKLLNQCPDIDAALGEKIAMRGDRLSKYVVAQNTYTTIVFNRARTRFGLRPLQCYGGQANIFKTSFAQLFPDAAPIHELIDTVKAERAAEKSGQ